MGYDSYDQTNKQVKRTSDGYWGGSGGNRANPLFSEAEVPSVGGEGFEAESSYSPGSLLRRAAEIAVSKVVDMNLGEENLGPQPA